VSQLTVRVGSDMDRNLENEWDSTSNGLDDWIRHVKSLPLVMDVEYVVNELELDDETLITFESEAHKSWFILRYA
jgi:hypothetical protein